jgi:hypothetical protein
MKKIYKSQAHMAAEMVYLDVHEGPAAVARAMGQSMDSATAHIAFYVRDIRRSENLRRAVLHKRAELLQARRAASALVAAGGAGADEDDRLDRKRHNVIINAKGSALAAVCCLTCIMYEKDTLKMAQPQGSRAQGRPHGCAGGHARQQAGARRPVPRRGRRL